MHANRMDGAAAPWWSERTALQRFVADLVAGELAALRHDRFLQPDTWTAALSLQDELSMDSLEFMQVGAALASALQMQHSGVEDYLLARRTLGDWTDIASLALQHWSSEIVFSTSGSTGTPRHCGHALGTLEQEAQALAALLPGRRRLLVAVPSHHIYGFLFTQLLPRYLGLDPGQVVGIRARLPSQLARHAEPGDLVIGHPQFWQAALVPDCAFPPDVAGVTSTAPCPDAVAEAATAAGLSTLVQVYGASETGGIGWRASHRDAYRLLPHVEHAGGALLRTGPDGTVRELLAPDELTWRGAREFLPGPRRDGAVQVAGVNVFPERVRQALLQHPQVADAAVRLMRPDEGKRLKAFIVPRADSWDEAALAHALRAWIGTTLTAPECPKALAFGARLPRNPMGKLADWSIAEPLE
jgi:4-coumarate--CoA ligase (photoactive yellow protein activation family)